MINKVLSTSLIGMKAQKITIEVDLSSGLPQIIMVGLPDKSIQESKERIRTSFKSLGIEFPLAKITVNLAPADVIKNGSQYDLAISLGILKGIGVIKSNSTENSIFLGELSLDGTLNNVQGILPMILAVKNTTIENIFIPMANRFEASLVGGVNVYCANNLKEVIDHLNGVKLIPATEKLNKTFEPNSSGEDFKLIKGQVLAKKALEIAAAGSHNVMMVGEPGCGKTLLARAFCSILPPLNDTELLEVAQIYSIKGLSLKDIINLNRPFRAPHHSSSNIALTGGGNKLMPGEVSLAHRGVLFLDEFAEFATNTIECLRQPVEDGFVQISRAVGSVIFPSKFILICASNPSPSGFDSSSNNGIVNHTSSVANSRYRAKLSGPISDRIDLHLTLIKPKNIELLNNNNCESSEQILKRVIKARQIQADRFKNTKIFTNSEMSLEDIKTYCVLNKECESLLNEAITKYKLSGRGYNRLLKISRTIADLDNSLNIEKKHILEGLMFRPKGSNT